MQYQQNCSMQLLIISKLSVDSCLLSNLNRILNCQVYAKLGSSFSSGRLWNWSLSVIQSTLLAHTWIFPVFWLRYLLAYIALKAIIVEFFKYTANHNEVSFIHCPMFALHTWMGRGELCINRINLLNDHAVIAEPNV